MLGHVALAGSQELFEFAHGFFPVGDKAHRQQAGSVRKRFEPIRGRVGAFGEAFQVFRFHNMNISIF